MRDFRWTNGLLAVIGLGAAAAFLIFGCGDSTGPDDDEPILLPDFTLNDVNPTSPTYGHPIQFARYSDRSVAIIYFGRASCPGCRGQFAGLDTLISELVCEGYPVVGAMVNNPNEADEAPLLAEKNARIPAFQDLIGPNQRPLVGALWGCENGDELVVADTAGYRQYLLRVGSTHDRSLTDTGDRDMIKAWVHQLADPGETRCLTVAGFVRTDEEIGVPGVQVIADFGRVDTTETDQNGHWIFSNFIADSVTVWPVREECSFEPSEVTVRSSTTDLDFAITCPWSTVGGYVRDRFSNPVWSVSIEKLCGGGGTAETDLDTGYWFMQEIPPACVFRPQGDHMTFQPTTRTSSGNQQDLDFTVSWDLPVGDFTRTDVNPESPTEDLPLSFEDLASGKDCLMFFGMADCDYCIGEFIAFTTFIHELQDEQMNVTGFFVNHPDLAPYAFRLEYAHSDLPALQDILVEVGGDEIPALHQALGLEPWKRRMDSVLVLVNSQGRVVVKAILDEGHIAIQTQSGQEAIRNWLQNSK